MTEEKKEETSSTPAEEVKKEEKSAPVETKKEKSTPADKEEKEVEVPAKFKKLVEEIEKMAVIDLAELVKILEKKFGVSAAAPVAFQAVGASSADGQEGGGEKSVFDIQLTGIGDKKIEVIKAVRDVMAKGLKESKDLVDAAEKEPQMIKENVKKDEAEEIKKKFEAAGAKVELK